MQADAAIRPPDQRQTWRDRIDAPDRDPLFEQQRRRAETDLDRRQLAQEAASGSRTCAATRKSSARSSPRRSSVWSMSTIRRSVLSALEIGCQPGD